MREKLYNSRIKVVFVGSAGVGKVLLRGLTQQFFLEQ